MAGVKPAGFGRYSLDDTRRIVRHRRQLGFAVVQPDRMTGLENEGPPAIRRDYGRIERSTPPPDIGISSGDCRLDDLGVSQRCTSFARWWLEFVDIIYHLLYTIAVFRPKHRGRDNTADEMAYMKRKSCIGF